MWSRSYLSQYGLDQASSDVYGKLESLESDDRNERLCVGAWMGGRNMIDFVF